MASFEGPKLANFGEPSIEQRQIRWQKGQFRWQSKYNDYDPLAKVNLDARDWPLVQSRKKSFSWKSRTSFLANLENLPLTISKLIPCVLTLSFASCGLAKDLRFEGLFEIRQCVDDATFTSKQGTPRS